MCFLWPCPKCYKKAKRKSKRNAKPKQKPAAEQAIEQHAAGSLDRLWKQQKPVAFDPRISFIPILERTPKPEALEFPQFIRSRMDDSPRNFSGWPNAFARHPRPSGPQRHNLEECPCAACAHFRGWKQLNTSPEHRADEDGNDRFPPSPRPPSSNITGTRPNISPPRRAPNAFMKDTTPAQVQPSFMSPAAGTAYPQVYVCPRSSPHLSFPVLDYSRTHGDPSSTPWPHLYVAIVPENAATLVDLVATLAPKGSGVELSARAMGSGELVEITRFGDGLAELRDRIIQLEVWDEEAMREEKTREAKEKEKAERKKVRREEAERDARWGYGLRPPHGSVELRRGKTSRVERDWDEEWKY
ncbi:uncharacterized protein BCR38DRAFT_490301 [Pseudomassariella vexata]|uniref:Uncharacterized protein n=1 Tax=Pseudomassariella vexata TaxID=1141098 RepID=A0A1Y2DC55_9PEZI|nr:uncharacterized protein BCR38DRAFT_490301 [Pseudomassariella vexata]ORY56853.1 hypothetical protein BCR38DRAFT_490301 [Pseudomassariella vexata]